jgi:hypothetical protein
LGVLSLLRATDWFGGGFFNSLERFWYRSFWSMSFREDLLSTIRWIEVTAPLIVVALFGHQRFHRLDPTPHSSFVVQVLFTELALQIALLALDDPTLDHEQRNRQ